MLPLLLALALSQSPGTPRHAAQPVFSLSAGSYSGTQHVTVTTATKGATIRCTTDGTDPTITSPAYVWPVQLIASATLKCKAWARNRRPSLARSAVYTVTNGIAVSPEAPTIAPGEQVTFATVPFVAVTSWSASVGSITSAGVYTAPPCSSAVVRVLVTATLAGSQATAKGQISDKVTAVEISPASATVAVDGTLQFSATVKTVCFPSGVAMTPSGAEVRPAILTPPKTFGGPTTIATFFAPRF